MLGKQLAATTVAKWCEMDIQVLLRINNIKQSKA